MIADSDRKTLLDLRLCDRETDRLRERAMVVPRELERLEKELKVHQDLLDEQNRYLQDIRLERRAAEREVEAAKARRREFEAQQYKIRNNQEYQANLREIENMKHKASQFDDKTLEILEQEEEFLKEIERLKLVVEEERRKHDLATAGLKEEFGRVERDLAEKDAKRSAVVERLSPSVRAKYVRIRRSKGDLAIVGAEARACEGCGYALPPQRMQEIRRNRELVLCEGCGRILIAVDE